MILPKRRNEWINLDVCFVGICGSDVQKMESTDSAINLLGHEIVAKYKNNYVVVNPLIGCKSCVYCKANKVMFCTELKAIGRNLTGGLSGVISAPKSNVRTIKFKKPELGVLCDPYAVVMHGLHRRKLHGKVTVIGDGIIAQLCLLYISLHSTQLKNCTLLVKNTARAEALKFIYTPLLQKQGIAFDCYSYKDNLTEIPLANIVIEAVGRGQAETINKAIEIVGNGGTILSFGVYPLGYLADIHMRQLLFKEVVLVGANSYTNDDFKKAIHQITGHSDYFYHLLGTMHSVKDNAFSEAAKHTDERAQKIIVNF